MQSPVLQSPDFTRPFILQTDASDRGIGAVLSLEDPEGKEHPIAYFSKKLLLWERHYSTVEKECLAIKLGIQAFRFYLMGRPLVIQTDHHSLVVGQTQEKQCSFDPLESGPTALPIYGAAQSGESKQQCGCTVLCRLWATDCRAAREGGRSVMDQKTLILNGCMT